MARDETLSQWAAAHPDRDIYEDRKLEITSIIDIDADQQIAAVRTALGSSHARVTRKPTRHSAGAGCWRRSGFLPRRPAPMRSASPSPNE
jgi:hypothetical protein